MVCSQENQRERVKAMASDMRYADVLLCVYVSIDMDINIDAYVHIYRVVINTG